MQKEESIFYSSCPACESLSIRKVLTAKDYTVSNQPFEVWECGNCTLRFTQGIPVEQQIGKYYQSDNYISHSNTSKGLINKLYLLARNTTLSLKKRLIHKETGGQKGNLLDIGAGTGAFASYMKAQRWNVTGLEPDAAARENAKQLHDISLQPVEELFQLPAGHFQVITLWHVLEHVHQLHANIEQIKKLLSNEGVLFIAVPNYTSYDAAVYREYWAAYDVPRHLYHFSPSSMRIFLSSHGLRLKRVRPMWFDSYYVSLLSEKYKTGKASLLKGYWYGSLSNLKTIFNKEKSSSLIYVIVKRETTDVRRQM